MKRPGMARRNITLAIAIVFALVALLPARGQTGSAVTTTLSNVKFGVVPTDNTKTWTAELRLVNRDSVAPHNEIVRILDADGNQAFATGTWVYGGTNATNGCISYISPLGEERIVLAGLTAATFAVPLRVTVEALDPATERR